MSAGNKIVNIRMDESLRNECEGTIATRNRTAKDAWWTFSDFVRVAVAEKIDKMRRSRRKPAKKN